jgi:presenilin-like A22 family membrane protease
MTKFQKFSICLLSITALLGVFRGVRMILNPSADALMFPYPEEMMKASVFSNYTILGSIILSLVGVLSILAIILTVKKVRNYAYFIIVEGIFLSFFTLCHMLYAGFNPVHIFVMPMSIAILILGVLQTPREF